MQILAIKSIQSVCLQEKSRLAARIFIGSHASNHTSLSIYQCSLALLRRNELASQFIYQMTDKSGKKKEKKTSLRRLSITINYWIKKEASK